MKTDTPELIESGYAWTRSGLVHRVWEPDGAGPHPTIVLSHGRSGNEDVAWVFARTLPKNWLLIAPRAIYADPNGGFSWSLQRSGDWPDLASFEPAVNAFSHFVDSLPSLYNADPTQTYLLGFSQGAAVSYTYAMQQPKRVQGIAGLVGLIPTDTATSPLVKNLCDVPVFMAVGRKDATVPMHIATDCAHALIAGGARLDYREYDTGHKLNGRGMRDMQAWWQQFE